jgi:hypothetical protein
MSMMEKSLRADLEILKDKAAVCEADRAVLQRANIALMERLLQRNNNL